MKSEIIISRFCFSHYVDSEEALKLKNQPLYSELTNQTTGKKIPGMKKTKLVIEDIVREADIFFSPEGSTLSRFDEAKFVLNYKSYEKLIRDGEFHASCGLFADLYVGILGRMKEQ